jgi:hypothetical protein
MTEAEWLACNDPEEMLRGFPGKPSPRKLRLFACACLRRIWEALADERSRQAVLVAERYADRRVDQAKLKEAWDAATAAFRAAKVDALSVAEAAMDAAHPSVSVVNTGLIARWVSQIVRDRRGERAAQAVLLRDLFGNPFRPLAACPAWRTPDVIALGKAIYEEGAFERMPILADVLEEAGCADEQVLAHCRGTGEHARGCWVVDLLRSVD